MKTVPDPSLGIPVEEFNALHPGERIAHLPESAREAVTRLETVMARSGLFETALVIPEYPCWKVFGAIGRAPIGIEVLAYTRMAWSAVHRTPSAWHEEAGLRLFAQTPRHLRYLRHVSAFGYGDAVELREGPIELGTIRLEKRLRGTVPLIREPVEQEITGLFLAYEAQRAA